MSALCERRRQVGAVRTAEQHRLGAARAPRVHAHIQAQLAWLETELAEVDKELHWLLRASPLWRERDNLRRGVPGIGPVLSLPLWADLPEPGRLSHGQIAALVGGAPPNRDRGTPSGPRPRRGCRGA